MGLGFRVGDESSEASWSYGGFHRFRKKIAKEIGLKLEDMDGFSDMVEEPDGVLVAPLDWDMVEDPIKPFLCHCDCEGVLTHNECEEIAPRLVELASNFPDEDYDKEMARELAESMRKCVELKCDLVFC